MKMRSAAVIAIVALAFGMRVSGHHSFAAEFDASKAIRLTGTLTKSSGPTPHLFLHRRERRGWQRRQVGLRGRSPGALSRRGFKRGDLKLGDTVIVDGYRAKDGSNLVDARRVTLPDGRIVSGASAGDGGPGDPEPRTVQGWL